ncbi:MAG: hypothetical protein IPL65_14770 [Lewinellaceae bacterium]|nr:hypothetical protein [Lewinellaceae bacterium]
MNHDNQQQGKDELEKALHTEFQRFAPEAPDVLWDGIAARIAAKKRRKSLLFWCFWGTGLLGLAVLLAVVFHNKPSGQHAAGKVEAEIQRNEEGANVSDLVTKKPVFKTTSLGRHVQVEDNRSVNLPHFIAETTPKNTTVGTDK